MVYDQARGIFDAYRDELARTGQMGAAEEVVANARSLHELDTWLYLLTATRGDGVWTSDCQSPTGGGRRLTVPLTDREDDHDAVRLSLLVGNQD